MKLIPRKLIYKYATGAKAVDAIKEGVEVAKETPKFVKSASNWFKGLFGNLSKETAMKNAGKSQKAKEEEELMRKVAKVGQKEAEAYAADVRETFSSEAKRAEEILKEPGKYTQAEVDEARAIKNRKFDKEEVLKAAELRGKEAASEAYSEAVNKRRAARRNESEYDKALRRKGLLKQAKKLLNSARRKVIAGVAIPAMGYYGYTTLRNMRRSVDNATPGEPQLPIDDLNPYIETYPAGYDANYGGGSNGGSSNGGSSTVTYTPSPTSETTTTPSTSTTTTSTPTTSTPSTTGTVTTSSRNTAKVRPANSRISVTPEIVSPAGIQIGLITEDAVARELAKKYGGQPELFDYLLEDFLKTLLENVGIYLGDDKNLLNNTSLGAYKWFSNNSDAPTRLSDLSPEDQKAYIDLVRLLAANGITGQDLEQLVDKIDPNSGSSNSDAVKALVKLKEKKSKLSA